MLKKRLLRGLAKRCSLLIFFVVPRHNRGGGLALLWKDDIDLDVLTSSNNHINGAVNQGRDDA